MYCSHISGISLSKIINSETQIIFTTAYSEFAVESYEINAIDYLLKPISLERFIKAMIVFLHARRDTIHADTLINYALSNKLAVLYATTENPVEFFFATDKILEIESYLQSVTSSYNIPPEQMLYCGMSLEGTRAIKLALFGQSDQSIYKFKPKAIAICDAPLDMVRFHKEMVKAKKLNYNTITANEGHWVSVYLEKNLNGTPSEALSAYLTYSPYSYSGSDHSKLNVLKNIAVRAYTEPDVNWWLDTRRKDYYSMNAIDLAAFINELLIIGNEQAELITTQNKGFLPNGKRHPHSWSIVNEKELINWFIDLIN